MIKNKFYKHKNNTDVAIQVLQIDDREESDTIVIQALWWNIVSKNHPFAIEDEFLSILKKNLKDWEEYA